MPKHNKISAWRERSLSDIFNISSGESARYRPNDLSGPVIVYGANGPIGSYERSNFGPGYIIGRVGAAGEVTKVNFRVWASDNTLTAIPKKDFCNYGFGGHLLKYLDLSFLATKNAQPLITQSNLASLNAIIPESLEEQRRIAEILDTIDEAIQKTEALISKLEAMKQGLLHDLLTRGLDENGKLRDPKANPEKFKDSPLGKIPKKWKVCTLEKTATLQRGFDLPIQNRNPGSVPVFGSNGIDGYHDKTNLQGPGVITGRSGTIGHVYYSEIPYWPLNTTLYVKNFHGNNAKFIALLLESIRLWRFTAATGVPSLNRNFVHPLPVVVPNLDEQKNIIRVSEDFEMRLNAEQQYRDKLKLQKQGLMHDLLTGKVRVK